MVDALVRWKVQDPNLTPVGSDPTLCRIQLDSRDALLFSVERIDYKAIRRRISSVQILECLDRA